MTSLICKTMGLLNISHVSVKSANAESPDTWADRLNLIYAVLVQPSVESQHLALELVDELTQNWGASELPSGSVFLEELKLIEDLLQSQPGEYSPNLKELSQKNLERLANLYFNLKGFEPSFRSRFKAILEALILYKPYNPEFYFWLGNLHLLSFKSSGGPGDYYAISLAQQTFDQGFDAYESLSPIEKDEFKASHLWALQQIKSFRN